MRIGVVIPAHNAAPWIGGAIASVLAQAHRAFRLTVVDDGSTDATPEIAAGFGDARLRLIRQDQRGVSSARNRGAAALDADAYLFLDADDWLQQDALARLSAALVADSQAVAAAGPCALVGAGPCAVLRPPGGELLPGLLERNLFANCGHVLVRASALRETGGFRETLRYGEDWEFLIRLALRGRFACLHRRAPVLFVRRRGSGAYLRQATDPAAFAPCMEAIFGNPALAARFGAKLAALRARAEAENHWITGRALMTLGRSAEARAWLRRSLRAKPSAARACLLLAAHAPTLARRYFMGENAVGNSNVACISTSIAPP
jgi:glycosyltransferase involved in cell wall biosynthesis